MKVIMDVRRIKDYLTERSVSIASILEMDKLGGGR